MFKMFIGAVTDNWVLQYNVSKWMQSHCSGFTSAATGMERCPLEFQIFCGFVAITIGVAK
jgi:hypothetical protein